MNLARCLSRITLIAWPLWLSACATIVTTANHEDYGVVYAGTRMDCELIGSVFERQSGGWIDLSGLEYIVGPMALIDLPFSLVADTVVLPYTATTRRRSR